VATNATATAEATGLEAATEEDGLGYRAPQVCRLVGITYRQLDYWARTDLLRPSLQEAAGSGSQRRYSFTDIVQLKVIKRLLDAGMSLKRIRSAVEILRDQMASDRPLGDVTLLSDGQTIYAAHSADEVVDVFRRGQGVFGIAVGPVQEEVQGAIHELFPLEGDADGTLTATAEAT
jgi:DNA-binding transcriptional MerR regulator